MKSEGRTEPKNLQLSLLVPIAEGWDGSEALKRSGSQGKNLKLW